MTGNWTRYCKAKRAIQVTVYSYNYTVQVLQVQVKGVEGGRYLQVPIQVDLPSHCRPLPTLPYPPGHPHEHCHNETLHLSYATSH